MESIHSARLLATLSLIALVARSEVSPGSDMRNLDRDIDPVEVSGEVLSPISGAAMETIRVYASSNSQLQPIAFQIDQRNSAGDWVWTTVPQQAKGPDAMQADETSDLSATGAGDPTVDDQDPRGESVFDANDVLVFMARDIGDRHAKAVSEPGALLLELEISDPQKGTTGWVYIARHASDPPARSPQRYLTYHEAERRVVAPDYEFVYSTEHSVMLADLRINDVSILEQSRIRGKVKAGLGPIATTMDFDERAIDGYDAGYINGPVRVIKRSIDHVKVGAGMRSPDVNCDHYYYPWHAEVPMLFSMRFPIREVEILATSRYRSGVFDGARVTQINEPIGIGRDQHNTNLLADHKDARWLGLYGDGLAVIALIRIPANIDDYFGIAPHLVDDAGQAVEAGYRIQTKPDIVKGEHVLHSVYLILADSNGNDGAAKAIDLLNNKLQVEARRLQ